MARLVKGENLKNSVEENLKENIISLPKEKKYFVVTDDDGNIRGYFPIKEKTLGKDWVAMYQAALKIFGAMELTWRTIQGYARISERNEF